LIKLESTSRHDSHMLRPSNFGTNYNLFHVSWRGRQGTWNFIRLVLRTKRRQFYIREVYIRVSIRNVREHSIFLLDFHEPYYTILPNLVIVLAATYPHPLKRGSKFCVIRRYQCFRRCVVSSPNPTGCLPKGRMK
jgi:hypothetical protein